MCLLDGGFFFSAVGQIVLLYQILEIVETLVEAMVEALTMGKETETKQPASVCVQQMRLIMRRIISLPQRIPRNGRSSAKARPLRAAICRRRGCTCP